MQNISPLTLGAIALMHDDVRIVLVGTKSRLLWEITKFLCGRYKSVSISSFRLTKQDINEASLQGRNPNDLRISKLTRCLEEKEQKFRELAGKEHFTRPDCRWNFSVKILTVDIPRQNCSQYVLGSKLILTVASLWTCRSWHRQQHRSKEALSRRQQ